jgi:hypothetical protein
VQTGGDTAWLLDNGRTLLDGSLVQPPQTPPVYLIYDALVQRAFGDAAPQMLRILDCVWGAVLCGAVFVLGSRYFNRRVGVVAAVAIAIGPAFIIDAGNLLTEDLFMALLFSGLALYAVWSTSVRIDAEPKRPLWHGAVAVAILLVLAALTRATALLIPVVVIVDLFWNVGKTHRPSALRLIGVLMVSYIAIMSLWTVYYAARWHELVIGAQGVAANVFIGTSNWCGGSCIDQQAGITPGASSDAGNQSKYLNSAANVILANPFGYLTHRLSNELDAEAQPYNTVYYPGNSIKDQIAAWWSTGHTLANLGTLTQVQDFWPKAVLYLFHYVALLGGLIGLLIGLRRVRLRWPLYGVLLYFLALHFVLTAIPRYLFPIEPIWWLFAAFALVTITGSITNRLTGARSRNSSTTMVKNTTITGQSI